MTDALILTYFTFRTALGRAHPLRVSVLNPRGTEVQNVVVRLVGNSYYKTAFAGPATIAPRQEHIFTLDCIVWSGVGLNELGDTTIVAEEDNPQTKAQITVKFPLDMYTLGLLETKPVGDGTLNILFFGEAGAGKSSAIGGLQSLFNAARTVSLSDVPVGGGAAHCTTTLDFYEVRDSRIRLIDLWGTVSVGRHMTFTRNELALILEGLLPGGFSMLDSIQDEDMEQFKLTSQKRKVHAVLFFVAPGTISAQGQALLRAREFLDTLKGLNPIVVISRADEVTKAPVGSPAFHSDLDKLVTQASSTFNVPPYRVITLSNYVQSAQRDTARDRVYFQMLGMALDQAVVNQAAATAVGRIKKYYD